MRIEQHQIQDPERILSPGLVVFRELVKQNIGRAIEMAGGPERLRPHCKTHKMTAVARLQLEQGISRFKAATFAEAQMLAEAGATDILLSYNIVGPNLQRTRVFTDTFPEVAFTVTADDRAMIEQLDAVMSGSLVGVQLDVDPGRNRTGVAVGQRARELYELIDRCANLRPEGLHIYDGHQRQGDLSERSVAVELEWAKILAFRDELVEAGYSVPRLTCGGTPTFPVYTQLSDETLEFSPGTFVFHDAGYGESFADLSRFVPAAVVLTRVISRPTAHRVTLDVGTKAIAADPPMGQRLILPQIPDAVQVLQNEEHLVVETESADRWNPGDWTIAIPKHVCPTVALYPEAVVIEDGKIVDTWPVTARDRRITV